MTAETITFESLRDFETLLDYSRHQIHTARLRAKAGEISPSEAMEVIRDVVATINQTVAQWLATHYYRP